MNMNSKVPCWGTELQNWFTLPTLSISPTAHIEILADLIKLKDIQDCLLGLRMQVNTFDLDKGNRNEYRQENILPNLPVLFSVPIIETKGNIPEVSICSY